MTEFEYHEEDDVAVFQYRSYDDYDRSVDIANFVIDLDEENNFLGLEVIGASERLPLTKEELGNAEEVEIDVREDENGVMVSILIMTNDERTSLNLPVTGLGEQAA
jgi:uncharacterized protein YuzE